jgi:hypothetical protein
MILLPPNFDVAQFASDIITITVPFVSIASLFLAFYCIKKVCRVL